MPKLAIIGGSGTYNLLESHESLEVHTPYGDPSSSIEIGKISGVEVAFIPRHGKKHTIPPHMVNYRANIWALKKYGVERIVGVNAVGSLKEDHPPGEVFIPDQFIDFTRRRPLTFYDGPEVYHISAADPFCPDINSKIAEICKSEGIEANLGGTYVCIEGPRFSTRSESFMFRNFADIIGMTLVPEVNLVDEMAMCYSVLATITDYDVWSTKPVDTKEVLKVAGENEEKVQRILKKIIPAISGERKCSCSHRLDDAKI